MDGTFWLAEVTERVRLRIPEVEVSTPDDDMTTLMLGRRGVVLHAVGERVMLAPSTARGTTIAERLEERVEHSDALVYALNESTLDEAAAAASSHLRSAHFSSS